MFTKMPVGQAVIRNAIPAMVAMLMVLIYNAFGWNIAGAAIATVVGNLVAALYYIGYYAGGHSGLSIRLKDFSAGDGIAALILYMRQTKKEETRLDIGNSVLSLKSL